MKSNLSRLLVHILPHLTVILSVLCLLLFVLDQFNSTMMFLANGLTKWIFAVLSICAAYCGVTLIAQRFMLPARKHHRPQSGEESIAPDEAIIISDNDVVDVFTADEPAQNPSDA